MSAIVWGGDDVSVPFCFIAEPAKSGKTEKQHSQCEKHVILTLDDIVLTSLFFPWTRVSIRDSKDARHNNIGHHSQPKVRPKSYPITPYICILLLTR